MSLLQQKGQEFQTQMQMNQTTPYTITDYHIQNFSAQLIVLCNV